MNALDLALEAAATVILLGTVYSAFAMTRTTKNVEIVAVSKPQIVSKFLALAFSTLFLSSLLGLVSDLLVPIPHIVAVQESLVIATALCSVFAVRTALYLYRVSSDQLKSTLKSSIDTKETHNTKGGKRDAGFVKPKRET